MRNPWQQDVAEVADTLATDIDHGLAADVTRIRLERYGYNVLEPERETPAWRKLLAQFADPLVYLLLAAIVVSAAAWILEGTRGIPCEASVILNAVIGYVQEVRVEQAVATLQQMAAATTTVILDGREQHIPSTDIVPGDILLLSEGDAVGADARLAHAASLVAAEASLTGESEPVLNNAFGTTPLTLREWAICAALASVVLWAEEARKLLRHFVR